MSEQALTVFKGGENNGTAVLSNLSQSEGTSPIGRVSSGMQSTTSMNGGVGTPAILLETMDLSRITKLIQFNLNNSESLEAINEIIRIGSIAASKGAYSMFDLTIGASDSAIIKDQLGAGAKRVEAFSRFVSFNPVLTQRIKIFCDEALQLQEPIYHKELQMDGTRPLSKTIDIAYTQGRGDQRNNLVEAGVVAVLDSTRYFEYKVLAGSKLALYLEIGAVSNTETFTPVTGVFN